MFQANTKPEQKINKLEQFLNMLVNQKESTFGGGLKSPYLTEKRVQEFLQISDAEILMKIRLMQMSSNSEPISKVYTKLNIIDEYQSKGNLSSFSETMQSLDSHSQKKLSEEPNSPQKDTYGSFNIKVIDRGTKHTKFDLSFKGNVWILSKSQDLVDAYIESIDVKMLSGLNVKN